MLVLYIMETPTLTKKQQKKALSSKKQTQKSIRNVLSVPYESYWPVVNEDEDTQLCGLLESALQPARQPSQSVPWSELKNIPRAQRRDRKRALVQPGPPESKELRQLLLLGVNALTRALENDACACALLAKDVDPLVLTRHIASLCMLHKVPLLVTRSLRSTTRNALGFSCIALGLKKDVANASDNHFHSLYLKIKELSAAFPWTEPMTLFHDGPLESSEDSDHSDNKEARPTPVKPIIDPYLYRSSCKERAFDPTETQLHPDSGMETSKSLESEFLALGSESDGETDAQTIATSGANIQRGISIGGKWNTLHRQRKRALKPAVPHYKEPVIKRIRSNPNKVKKRKKATKTVKL